MNFVCGVSAEEEIAYQLSTIAVQLHKRGLTDPFRKVIKARDALLDILDGNATRPAKSKKTAQENKTFSVVTDKEGFVPSEHLLQDTKTRKSEFALV